jgi:hypothetical protein
MDENKPLVGRFLQWKASAAKSTNIAKIRAQTQTEKEHR